ncbi:MAG: thioredoxin domain-containing protein [Deltaproteobacteria bacterium]|nr:thioredoxin domain-containing protein [Deltaproteobacteria bacterium]
MKQTKTTAWTAAALLAIALLLGRTARAGAPACEALEGQEKADLDELFSRLKPYECCTGTFSKCLAAPVPCPLVERLANELCRLSRLGKDKAALEKAYDQRQKSMVAASATLSFALDESARLGDPKAPVTLVIYACTRCPFCRDLVLALHREVTEDALKGKVKLYLRPFPLKGHEGAAEGAMALMAAGRQDRFWPFALYTFKHFDEFHPAVLADWAEFVKLDRAAFDLAMDDSKLRDALTEAKKEGVRNKVEATPTLFINGRRWSGELEVGSVVDALLEEHERVTAKK